MKSFPRLNPSAGSGVARPHRLSRLLQRGDARVVVREPEEVPPAGALRWPVDCKCGSGEGGGLDLCAELMFVSEIAEEQKALPFPP